MPDLSRPFFDTNVLLYAASDDPRANVANELLSVGGVISVQVLNEFVSTSRGKYRQSWPEIRQNLDAFRDLCKPILSVTLEMHDLALRLAEEYRYHIYDATIIAAALKSGCDVLYSEDMQHGQRIDNLVIRNPFRSK